MRTLLALVTAVVLQPATSSAHRAEPAALLIDHLVGHWVLTGTISNQQTTHDIDAEWVLNHGYVRMHEVSREKDATGAPAYEAIVFISFDAKTGTYACLWLDGTSNAGLSNGGVAHGTPTATTIPLLFALASGERFHTTFIYAATTDSWTWTMDSESAGKLDPFARVKLSRKSSSH